MIKVRRKYAVSKAHVRLKHSKSTVKYSKRVKELYCRKLFLAPTVHHPIIKITFARGWTAELGGGGMVY